MSPLNVNQMIEKSEQRWSRISVGRLGRGASLKTCWQSTANAANLLNAVRTNEEVEPVDAVNTWVLPSGITVGR